MTTKVTLPKMADTAARISAHLKRFEADPKINAPRPTHGNTRPYYAAWASAGGSRIRVQYISYLGQSSLTKAEAIAYLEWLDAGNVGDHYTWQWAAQKEKGK